MPLAGTAGDNVAVVTVELAIYRGSDGNWFDGTNFVTGYTRVALPATGLGTPSVTWSFNFNAEGVGSFAATLTVVDTSSPLTFLIDAIPRRAAWMPIRIGD